MPSDVNVVGSNRNGPVQMQVDQVFHAARVSIRPYDYTDDTGWEGGHYYVNGVTGLLTGVGANGPIFSMRWTDNTHPMILEKLTVAFLLTTAYTTPQFNDFELIRAIGFTVADSTGTVLTPQKKRSNMGTSSMADIRIASTAALTAGTRTLDAFGYKYVAYGQANVAAPSATLPLAVPELVLYEQKDTGNHPIILGAAGGGEGLIVRMPTAMGAAGVMKAYFNVEWAEVATF